MDVFCEFGLNNIFIKSEWLSEKVKVNMYKKMGKEEGLSFYINLFRFRMHKDLGNNADSWNTHYFKFTIGEMLPFVRVNHKRKPRYSDIVGHLQKFQELGLLEFYDVDVSKLKGNKTEKDALIKCKATDTLKYNNKGEYIENFIAIPSSVVDVIFNDGYTSKTLAMWVYMFKYANNPRNAYYAKRETAKTALSIGNTSLKNRYIELNKLRLVATSENKNEDGNIRYHHIVNNMKGSREDFYDAHGDVIDKFLKVNCEGEEDEILSVAESIVARNII